MISLNIRLFVSKPMRIGSTNKLQYFDFTVALRSWNQQIKMQPVDCYT